MERKYWALILVCLIGAGLVAWWALTPTEQPPVYHKGEIEPQVESFATDDSTDIDGAGTWEIWSAGGDPRLYETALTWGTDSQTVQLYESGVSFWFVMKSTTANAMDHFSYLVTLPFADEFHGDLYDIDWDEANTQWDITFKGGQEATPTLKAYDPWDVEVGTTAQDLSDRDYVLDFTLTIAIASNYDALFYFFDPEEGNAGEWDRLYLIMTCNVSAANAGWTVDSPWQVCSDGKSYYLDLDQYMPAGGMLIRWDEQQMVGKIEVPITIRSSDIDTSGAGAALFTINLKECNDEEHAPFQTWESDTLTNLAGAVTAETITVQD